MVTVRTPNGSGICLWTSNAFKCVRWRKTFCCIYRRRGHRKFTGNIKVKSPTLASKQKHHPHLLGKVIQQGVEAFEAALVDCHPDAPELAVAAFVESDALGRGGCGQMCVAWVRGGRLGEGRCMFRCRLGVPRPGLVRKHAAASHKPRTQTYNYPTIPSMIKNMNFPLISSFKRHCFLFEV